ncbi:MAG: ATP-binding protein [Desulfuromonadales bacterium]
MQLTTVALAVVLINLLIWLVGSKLFLDEARRMGREKALRQAARIDNLLQREAGSLQRVLLSRADRLGRDSEVRRSGLVAVDFAASTSDVFLSGANIDAYLVEDVVRTVLFARRREPLTDTLVSMSPSEHTFLSELSLSYAAENGRFTGLTATPDGAVAIVSVMPVGHQPLYGWLVAQRDLDADQIATYGDIVESPFAVRVIAASVPPNDGSPEGVIIDASSGQVRWHLPDLVGKPTLQLTMAYNGEYEQHMAKLVAISRGGILVLSSLAGIFAALLLWRRQASRLRERIIRQEEERIARLAAVGELAAGVAHEVNNPIGMIRRNLDFVRDTLHDALPLLAERDDAGLLTVGGIDLATAREQLPQLLDDMEHGSRRIGEIVRDLKDFARDDALADGGPFDLNEAVAAAVRLLDGSIRKATDYFSLGLGSGLPLVAGSLRQIEQVVLNLVQNACQALPDRTRAIAVTTRYDASGHRCLLEVVDEGCGIAPENRERIFEPFFTTRRESGGTGLGLSVSLRIVRRHGGNLEFDSLPGSGTRATVSLPITEERS